MDIGVIGAGGWGIALAKLLADKGEQVTLWCHGADTCRDLTENEKVPPTCRALRCPLKSE